MAHGDKPDAAWRSFVMDSAGVPATSLPVAPTTTGLAPSTLSTGPQLAPSVDVIDLLPPVVADRVRTLRLRSADAHRIVPEFESVREASMAKVAAANALKRLTDHPQDGGHGMKPDARPVIEAQKLVDKTITDFNRLQELQQVRVAAWQTASGALANVEAWLRSGRPGNTTLEVVEIEQPKPGKGESGLLDQIETRRRRVRELRADLHRIASAPYPSAHARAKVRAEIEALAQAGAPVVTNIVEHDAGIIWPVHTVRSAIHTMPPGVAHAEVPDAIALVAWLHKDAMIAALDREIASEASDDVALSHEARQQREAETMGDLIEIERQEAQLVFRAQSEGLPVEHRADISPLALLGVRLITAPRTISGSSPEHASYSFINAR
jgi:hypothetical protein